MRPNVPAETAGEQVLTVEELSKLFQRFDEDDFALAAAGAGQPPVRVRRPQAGRFPAELGRSVRGPERGARPSRVAVQPIERRRADDDHRATPGGWPTPAAARPKSLRRLAEANGSQRRDDSLHAQAVRSGASRIWRSSRRTTGRLIGRQQEEDLPAVSPRRVGRDAGQALLPHEDQHLSHHQRDAGRADLGIAAGFHPQSGSLPGPMRRDGFSVRCRSPSSRRRRRGCPAGLPPYLASLYEVPLLTREQEAHLFRKFNFLKYKAGEARARGSIRSRAKSSVMDQIERLYDEAVATKNQIVRANLRLVVSIAKRHVGPTRQLLRAGQRRQHVVDAGGREVRLRPRQQVQHVRQLGDHEELRPHDSRRTSPPRPFPHQPVGDVLGHRGRSGPTSTSRRALRAQRESQVEQDPGAA